MTQFSIIIPSYNNAETIGETISSALNQNYSNYEIIVSDNASTDATNSVLQGFYGKPKLTIYEHAEFVSKTENWNRAYALANSSSSYFINLHADDTLFVNTLEHIDQLLRIKPNAALVFGGHRAITFEGEIIADSCFPIAWSAKGYKAKLIQAIGNSISVVGTCINKEAFYTAGGWSPEYCNYYNDVDLFYKIIENGGQLNFINKIFGLYRRLKIVSMTRKGLMAALTEQLEWNYVKFTKTNNFFLKKIFATQVAIKFDMLKGTDPELAVHYSYTMDDTAKYILNEKMMRRFQQLIKLSSVRL